MAVALILMVKLGVPVGVLFAAGYWLEHRDRSRASQPRVAMSQRAQGNARERFVTRLVLRAAQHLPVAPWATTGRRV